MGLGKLLESLKLSNGMLCIFFQKGKSTSGLKLVMKAAFSAFLPIDN